ncbi:hypothetical protein BGX28_009803 [Mortierella sp. GBA30]|nr:hypothetical protein BGX28_009803 [Mortierella sp. GBA30]
MKSIFTLLSTAALASISLASVVPAGAGGPEYKILIGNNAGKGVYLTHGSNDFRQCYCLSNTLTVNIKGYNGGLIQVYGSKDCSGGFQVVGSDSQLDNAQWVNSVVFGPGGVKTLKPGNCPKYY